MYVLRIRIHIIGWWGSGSWWRVGRRSVGWCWWW